MTTPFTKTKTETQLSYTNCVNVYANQRYIGDLAYFEDGTYRQSAHVDAVQFDTLEDCVESMLIQEFGQVDKRLRESVQVKPKWMEDGENDEFTVLFLYEG